jgi:hypothetical protein
MKQLLLFREKILEDINEYYLSHNQIKELEVNAEVQIEIIRFIVAKLKICACDIFTQLKYL